MPSFVKSAVWSLGLLAGMAASAHAQSVSALPPAGATPGAVQPPAYSSTQGFYPKPGGNAIFSEQRYQPPADYESDRAKHPYSTSIGPKPGSHSSGQDERYQATDKDSEPGRHPYTSTGTGPKPGG
jgi:hypothetical protein